MSYEVKHVKEINYLGMSEKERKEIWRLDDLRFQEMGTCFDDENDYFALYKDLDIKDEDCNDDRTYAVYLNNSGELLCLLHDAGVALNGCVDADYYYERLDLYKKIAMLAGWPEKLPAKKRYTVRISRFVDVEVYADDDEQACAIGRNLAVLANHVGNPYGSQVRMAMSDREYEFTDAWGAPSEEDGVWDLPLTANECMQILNKEE